MDTQQIHAAAAGAGVVPAAFDEVTARVRDHFGDGQPKPVDLTSFIAGLPAWTKINMPEEAFLSMPPDWRLGQARTFEPPPQSRRPVMRTLTAAELATLEGLPFLERYTRGRALQQSPPPEPAG